jgi:murein hydrolase activator
MRISTPVFALSLFCLLLLGTDYGYAQAKKRRQLEAKKGESLKKIEETNRILNQTREKKAASLTQLNLIKQKIKVQEVLIQTMNEEINYLDVEIKESESIILALDRDMKALKEEYARMVVIAYKYSSSFDKLAYMFSAENFRQMANRYQYFKQYSAIRSNQVEQIEAVSATLERERARLLKRRNEKARLAGIKTVEARNLSQAKSQHDNMLIELSSKEKQLREELEESKKSVLKLEKLIVDLIEEERRKAIEAAKKAEAEAKKAATIAAKKSNTTSKSSSASKSSSSKSTAALKELNTNVALSSSFAGNKGKLPWPVNKGRVAQHFGKQAHPVLKGVFIENLGVDIATVAEEPVKAVFGGKVLTVAQVPGMNYVVMIQHGEYFTVYAKLKSVTVSTGQAVERNTILGQVYTDKGNSSEVQFQIWRNEEKLDPESWLYNK